MHSKAYVRGCLRGVSLAVPRNNTLNQCSRSLGCLRRALLTDRTALLVEVGPQHPLCLHIFHLHRTELDSVEAEVKTRANLGELHALTLPGLILHLDELR